MRRRTGAVAKAALAVMWAALLLPGWGTDARAQAAPPAEGGGTLGLIESFYREGEAFRAETEVLRFLHERPRDPRQAEVELVRAKLYYREGRYAESSLMLFSQLDRFPGGPAAVDARRLLAFSLVREGRLDEAEPLLAGGNPAAPPLASLREVPPDAVDPDSAVAWSTWLPGSGFFLVDQPGKAVAAMGLNLFFIGAAAASFNNDLPGPGLIFLLVEVALYRGGREAVRDAAEQQVARLRREREDAWLDAQGEPELLRIGFRVPFGGG